MIDPTTRKVALELRALAAECRLTTLPGIRIERTIARQAMAAASRLLGNGNFPGLVAGLSAVDWLPDLLDLASRLLWSRQHDATRAVVAVARAIDKLAAPVPPGQGAPHQIPWREVCDGYITLTDLTERGPTESGMTLATLREDATGLFLAADAHLEGHDTTRAALVASAALWLLFHQELHDSDPTSPLLASAHDWLQPLHGSRVGQLLTTDQTHRTRTRSGRSGRPADQDGIPRSAPLVLTGAYPRFAGPVIEALRADTSLEVSTLALSTVDKPFKRMAVEPWVVELRLRRSMGEHISYTPLQDALAGADTVLADWADAGAALASLLAPPDTALTVRAHSVDALRCWLHLIDWSAVDQLICVGPHIRDVIRDQLGQRLSQTRQVVLPNIVHLGRFDHPRGPDTDFTLAMVGWARAVKDPLWTVELLSRLRRHDNRWRLLLIGHGFPDTAPPGSAAYAKRFARRIADPDVHAAIEMVPFTDDLPPVLAQVGWVVSSSVRESWGVGPMEAVAAGAVPIIRDWPFFARWGGPRRLYPDSWVVSSVEEAEHRMRHLVQTGRRSHVAASSRARLSQLVDPEQTGARYREALVSL